MPGENSMGHGEDLNKDSKITNSGTRSSVSATTEEELLKSFGVEQRNVFLSVAESINSENKGRWTMDVEETRSGLLKIYIRPKGMVLGNLKNPIAMAIKKDGKINIRIDQYEHYNEFYYNHLNADAQTIADYSNGIDDILNGEAPDEVFGKGNHELEKKEYAVPGGDINYYHEGKHMPDGFKSKNEKFNSGEFDTKK